VVFHPFIGAVIIGKIRRCGEEGVHVSLEFFEDILIPSELLQEGSEFDATEQLWVWRWEGNDMYMDIDEPVRCRIVAEEFTDVAPLLSQQRRSSVSVIGEGGGAAAAPDVDVEANSRIKAPYSIIATIQESGLGLLSWWQE